MKNKPQTLKPEDRLVDREENPDDYIEYDIKDVAEQFIQSDDETDPSVIESMLNDEQYETDDLTFQDVIASIYPPTLSNPVNPDNDTMLELAVKQSSIIQDFERLLINQHDAISTLRTQTFESIDECQSFVAMFNAVNEFIQLTGEQLAIAKTARYLKEHPQ